MPSSRATARRESPDAPVAANWRRASCLISEVSSARARSLAVLIAVMPLVCQIATPKGEQCS